MKYFIFCLLFVCALQILLKPAFAQAPAQVAVNTELADSDAQVGHILSVFEEGLKRSQGGYDPKIVGVVVEAPIISVQPKTEQTRAVASAGTALVRVSNSNGNIAVGDFITSSGEPGVGQKATESGYVLGKALGAFEGGDELLSVSIEIGYRQVGQTQAGGFLSSITSDSNKLRLILAAILAVVVLIVGTVSFFRVVTTGVAAIGRNPLARSTIIRGMMISGSVVVVVVGIGLAASIAIIMLGGGS